MSDEPIVGVWGSDGNGNPVHMPSFQSGRKHEAQRPVTDAEVKAAGRATYLNYDKADDRFRHSVDIFMRRALEAAREARS